jgi:hypothetical protein
VVCETLEVCELRTRIRQCVQYRQHYLFRHPGGESAQSREQVAFDSEVFKGHRRQTGQGDFLDGSESIFTSAATYISYIYSPGFTQEFDSVVVATGHYGAPSIPYFAGAKEWAERWPDKVIHSRAYRSPETYKDQVSVLSAATQQCMT